MRDGIEIHGQHYKHFAKRTVLLLHGTLASSYTYNKMSGLLREALQAKVLAVDLRGHGQSKGIVGDITTLNQYVEDLDNLISAIKNTPRMKLSLWQGILWVVVSPCAIQNRSK